jgi:hypothetical protein
MTSEQKKWLTDKDRKRAGRFPVSLMNDTKWREVWMVMTEMRLRFRFAYAGDDRWNEANSERLQGPFPAGYVQAKGIRDPGIGGPFFYKEILWVRVPRIPGNNIESFVAQVRSLGQLPVHFGPDYVEICAYEYALRANRPGAERQDTKPTDTR